MVDAVASQQKLHKILLSWDYFDLWKKCEEGGGVHDELKPVPQTFNTVEVGQGCRLATRGLATWPWVAVIWARTICTPSSCTSFPSTCMCACCVWKRAHSLALSTHRERSEAVPPGPPSGRTALPIPSCCRCLVAADFRGMRLQHLRTP